MGTAARVSVAGMCDTDLECGEWIPDHEYLVDRGIEDSSLLCKRAARECGQLINDLADVWQHATSMANALRIRSDASERARSARGQLLLAVNGIDQAIGALGSAEDALVLRWKLDACTAEFDKQDG
ncbi:hypothetical protein [Actinokineospora sp.]|uniref:hypothetical protein n=1 Tax=Actinokineospora sp. TaxID=1872133 RepID=UPI004037AD81